MSTGQVLPTSFAPKIMVQIEIACKICIVDYQLFKIFSKGNIDPSSAAMTKRKAKDATSRPISRFFLSLLWTRCPSLPISITLLKSGLEKVAVPCSLSLSLSLLPVIFQGLKLSSKSIAVFCF